VGKSQSGQETINPEVPGSNPSQGGNFSTKFVRVKMDVKECALKYCASGAEVNL
jgi:hypothetical protein